MITYVFSHVFHDLTIHTVAHSEELAWEKLREVIEADKIDEFELVHTLDEDEDEEESEFINDDFWSEDDDDLELA